MLDPNPLDFSPRLTGWRLILAWASVALVSWGIVALIVWALKELV